VSLWGLKWGAGNVVYTNRFMVDHLIEQNRWRKPAYFAVTVPEHMGWDPHFSLEGLVYRVNADTLRPKLDFEATRRNMYEVFRYRGLFKGDGSWDSTVYKDENASTLSRNYAAAHLQLGFEYRRNGRLDKGIQELERIQRMVPDYVAALMPLGGFYLEARDTAKALRFYRRMREVAPGDPEVAYTFGIMLSTIGDTAGALENMQAANRADPLFPYSYYAAYLMLWESGRREAAVEQLRQLVQLEPNDPSIRSLLEQRERELGLAPGFGPGPPPGSPFRP
jgi:tetratricopeptide (TPR) repeat protein